MVAEGSSVIREAKNIGRSLQALSLGSSHQDSNFKIYSVQRIYDLMQDFLILDFVIYPNLDRYEGSIYGEKVPHISPRGQVFCTI